MSHKELFRSKVVQADSHDEFLSRYYKHERFAGRGESYAECIRKGSLELLEKYGITWISRHDSNTGETVAWMPKPVRVFDYKLRASNGNIIRTATAVLMSDGPVVWFTEKMTKREALKAVSA